MSRVRFLMRGMIAMTIAFALPLVGITTLVLDLRPPAHHHAAVDPGAAFDAGFAQMHAHSTSERHQHDADEAVILDKADHHREHEFEEGLIKRSAGFSGDALLTGKLPNRFRHSMDVQRGANAAKLDPPYIGRLERPPKFADRIESPKG